MFNILKKAWYALTGIFAMEEQTPTPVKKSKKKRIPKKKVDKVPAKSDKKVKRNKFTTARAATRRDPTKKVKVATEVTKTATKKKKLSKVIKDNVNTAIDDLNEFKTNSEDKGKKRYMTRLINIANKAIKEKDADLVIEATVKINNYLEKNKG